MKDSGMGGFSKMRGGDGGMPHQPTAGPSGPRSSAGPRPTSAAATAAEVMVKEEPEDEDEAAGEEEYLPDDEYLAEEFGEWLEFDRSLRSSMQPNALDIS